MMVKETSFGVIFLGFIDQKQITEEFKAMGTYAASQLATAIQKSLSLDSEQKRNKLFAHANELITSLSQVAVSVNNAVGPQGVMEAMGDGLEKMHIHSMVFLLDTNSNLIHLNILRDRKI
jgi:hypothetical protein